MEEYTDQELLTLKDMQRLLAIGSTKCYELVASKEIPSVRIGRSIRVEKRDLWAWLEERKVQLGE